MDFSLPRTTSLLRRTPAALPALLSGLPDAWLSGSEGPGAWSPYQVVAHLASIEETDWMDRVQVFLERNPERPFRPVDREAGFRRFSGWSLADILGRFASVRQSNLEMLEAGVGEGDLGLRAVHPAFGTVTLGQLLATWVVHDMNHLGQIVQAMAKQYRDAVGPWRELLPILDAG
ncbi:MAG TPA: DinB family protein [Actinomycetota bacterium]|nr:DinB family protein [Actinomycetota bacterium]